jgi:hypothetical protein
MMSTKDMPIAPSLLKPYEEGFYWIGTNLDIFNNHSPCHLGVHNEVVPNEVLNLGFVPVF